MEQNVILLKGGQDYDVEPFSSADAYLVRLLGSEPARRAVLYLRSMQDDQGRSRAAVFVGGRQVGYLPLDMDEAVLVTVKACELHGAVARARGSLTASWTQPGKVQVKVNLAAPDDLLSNSARPAAAEPPATLVPDKAAVPDETPSPHAIDIPAVEQPAGVNEGAAMLSSSFEDAAAFIDLDELQPSSQPASDPSAHLDRSDTPSLAAGWTEDYPEWSPLTPKPSAVAQSPLSDDQAASVTSEAPADVLPGDSDLPFYQPPQDGWLASGTPPAPTPEKPSADEGVPSDSHPSDPEDTTS